MNKAPHPGRRRLLSLLRRPDSAIDMGEAALCISWEDQGELEVDDYLARLDALAAAARPRVPVGVNPRRTVMALNAFLFDEQGFRGNTWDYNDPQNSFLDRVLERRAGLPITLSLVYSEVARRLDLPIFGVNMPRHFMVRYVGGSEDLFVDPFNGGRIWSRAECEAQIASFGISAPARVELMLAPAPKRQVLARVLRNLKGVYMQRGEAEQALAALERILLLDPDEPGELRDRGILRARLSLIGPALDDFEQYVSRVPRTPDLPSIRRQAEALVRVLGRRN